MKSLNRIIILLIFANSFATPIFSVWKNCNFSEAESKKIFNVFFDQLASFDPGKKKMLNPKKCSFDIQCQTSEYVDVHFSASCDVLVYDKKSANHLKSTGKDMGFRRIIRIKPNQKGYQVIKPKK